MKCVKNLTKRTISLKFQQLKRSKNGDSFVTLKTKTESFETSVKAEEIVLNQLTQIGSALRFASQSGAKFVKVGNVNFSLSGKFYLYVNIDGQDYSTDELHFNLIADKTQLAFKNIQSIISNMYGIIRLSEGKSPFMTNEAKKVLSIDKVKLLN